MRLAPDSADSSEVSLRTGLRNDAGLAGFKIDDNFDLLIGSTAIAYDFVMVTENIKDFKNLKGIKLENWIVR